jgi:hypothetical protein
MAKKAEFPEPRLRQSCLRPSTTPPLPPPPSLLPPPPPHSASGFSRRHFVFIGYFGKSGFYNTAAEHISIFSPLISRIPVLLPPAFVPCTLWCLSPIYSTLRGQLDTATVCSTIIFRMRLCFKPFRMEKEITNNHICFYLNLFPRKNCLGIDLIFPIIQPDLYHVSPCNNSLVCLRMRLFWVLCWLKFSWAGMHGQISFLKSNR